MKKGSEWETMTPTPFLFRARMAMFVFPPFYGKTSVRDWRVRQREVGGYLHFEEMTSNIKDCGQTLRWRRRVSDSRANANQICTCQITKCDTYLFQHRWLRCAHGRKKVTRKVRLKTKKAIWLKLWMQNLSTLTGPKTTALARGWKRLSFIL